MLLSRNNTIFANTITMTMRVLTVNTSECTGGAAVAARRLTEALNNNGIKARMLVAKKQTGALYVAQCGGGMRHKAAFLYERLVIWANNLFSRKNLFAVSTADAGMDITRTAEFKEADIIHLHWISQGMLSLKSIRKILSAGKPVVWTMHDMWECTAICHHAHTCGKYTTECRECPMLRFPGTKDLAYRTFIRKRDLLEGARINFVAVSGWLADRARSSALLHGQPVDTIPNSLPLSKFKPLDRKTSRTALGIAQKHVIAFGAARIDTPIKGFHFLKEALACLVKRHGYARTDVCLLLFGAIRDKSILDDMPVEYKHTGSVSDEDTLSKIYSAADTLVSSSLYETFGQTLIEAQACGCLPVSFDNSGQTDIIRHKKNGYLAKYQSTDDLAAGIDWCIKTDIRREELRNEVQRRFSESAVANRYIEIYNRLINDKA